MKRVQFPQDFFVHKPGRWFIVCTQIWPLWRHVKTIYSELKHLRRQRERWKGSRFRLVKKQLCTCITPFCKLLCRRRTTTMWKCLISRCVEDVNTRRLSFSFLELWYSLLEFSSRKIRQHLTNRTSWNRCDKVWRGTNSLFKWCFRGRRGRCCLSSLIADWRVPCDDPTCLWER